MYVQNTKHPNGAPLVYRQLEFHETVDRARQVLNNRDIHHRCASISEGFSFTGTDSLDEAVTLATRGWEEGARGVERLLDRVDVKEFFARAANKPVLYHDFSGSEVDVAGFVQGVPEHMVDLHFSNRPIRSVKIIVGIDQHANVAKDKMLQKASSIFLAAEVLRLTGHIVEVLGIAYTGDYNGRSNNYTLYEIPILEAGKYISPAQLAFMVGHPSFLRRIIFANNELESEEVRSRMGFYTGGGYGYPHKIKPKVLEALGIMSEEEYSTTFVIDKDDGFGDVLDVAKDLLNQVRSIESRVADQVEAGLDRVA